MMELMLFPRSSGYDRLVKKVGITIEIVSMIQILMTDKISTIDYRNIIRRTFLITNVHG